MLVSCDAIIAALMSISRLPRHFGKTVFTGPINTFVNSVSASEIQKEISEILAIGFHKIGIAKWSMRAYTPSPHLAPP